MMTNVVAINRALKKVVLDDGQILPMTDFFRYGEDCSPDEASACVAGPDKNGNWFAVEFSGYGSGPGYIN